MLQKGKYPELFIKQLRLRSMALTFNASDVRITHSHKTFDLNTHQHLDLMITAPQKMAALAQSRLGLNRRLFARNCDIRRISKPVAEAFFNEYHLMNATQSAYNYGLYYKTELVAAASFSKGRRMRRLTAQERSFELIRFCCKDGISVAGGLSKLVKNFCRDKNAGDVMTYVDKQFSEGDSFIKAGFVKHSETEAVEFLINKRTFERTLNPKPGHCPENYYRVMNEGNVKLIYTPAKL